MKRCPQCNTVFEDGMIYCKEDGTTLVNEPLPLPSDFTPEDNNAEERTVIRNEPFTVNIPPPQIPEQQPPINQVQPPVNPYSPQVKMPEANRGCFKYSMFLLIGLILGGGIALGIVGFGFYYMKDSVVENRDSNIEEASEKTPANKSDETLDDKHSKESSSADASILNGRIIKSGAILRSLPNSNADKIDTLPTDDRIEILQRKSSTSRWYEVECEHGSHGWIDGNSIEFTE